MAGLIHIYCGDGKGKTTASVGLAVRAAGAGMRVLFTQFFKDGSSSEVRMLQKMENIQTMHCRTVPGRYRNMTEEQKAQAKKDYSCHLEAVLKAAEEADLLVLDESISACNNGVISEERLLAFLTCKPEKLEVVLTGRAPTAKLLSVADYVTEMNKIKHPFEQGIPARYGIEY